MLDGALLEVMRSATGEQSLEFDVPPRDLIGGYWAQLRAFRLRQAPEGWSGSLVARLMPDANIAAKETVFQTEVARQGYPTPQVRLAGGVDAGLGRAFMVMDLAPGAPVLEGLQGNAALVALPRLARRLPLVLATSLADLHRLDAEALRASLAEASIVNADFAGMLSSLGEGAALCGRDDLSRAALWLVDHRTVVTREVICHGDLHPFNLLLDTDGSVTVLDWSAALLAPAMYDVAFTNLILSEPPVVVPRPLRPLVRAAGRWLARAFRRAYDRISDDGLDQEGLGWSQGVVCLRALVEVAGWVSQGSVNERSGHPWLINATTFAARLSDLTGVPVRPR